MTKKITIEGLVQGIGYRPFVARLAEELNITGWARNTSGLVTVVAQQDEAVLERFVLMLKEMTPPGGYVLNVKVENIECEKYLSFIIEDSNIDENAKAPLIPVDLPTCPDCARELFDPTNRRYRHPFISCVNCGPRYTVIEELPYDRPRIVLKKFSMCPNCKDEYTAKGDRRRHAQTISCLACGPTLTYKRLNDSSLPIGTQSVAIDYAIEDIKNGYTIAIKDLGGFHFAASVYDEAAVETIGSLKNRQNKPYAVTFPDITSVKAYCELSAAEEELLSSEARPIVLLKKKTDDNVRPFVPRVCGESNTVGAMLPNNPVQLMVTKACGPLVMTSANASGDILFIDGDNLEDWFGKKFESTELQDEVNEPIKLGILDYNREILLPMDDSITRIVAERRIMSRRARGIAPTPVAVDLPDGIFAIGGDLKNTFLYTRDNRAYISTQLGDLADDKCSFYLQNERRRMESLFGLKAQQVVCDKHPGYSSTALAKEFAIENNIPVKAVQHHKAHVASVICEHGLKGQVLGVAFDGTGFGDDGTMWGSEFFLFDEDSPVKRVGSLNPFSLPKTDEAAKNCELPLLALMSKTGIRSSADMALNAKADLTAKLIKQNFNRITSTSMGRFFDAISFCLGFGASNTYEGEAACNLEYAASKAKGAAPLTIDVMEQGNMLLGDYSDLLNLVLINADSELEVRRQLALGVHEALADFILKVALFNRDRTGVNQVALSGGTFFNMLLTENTIEKLENSGFSVYINEKVPCGDGGLCLGQAYMLSRGLD